MGIIPINQQRLSGIAEADAGSVCASDYCTYWLELRRAAPPATLRVFSTKESRQVGVDQQQIASFLADPNQPTIERQSGPAFGAIFGGLAMVVMGSLMVREAWKRQSG